MRKIAERTSGFIDVVLYRGFDKKTVLNHVKNHNGKFMVVFATAEEFLNYPENIKGLDSSDYIIMFEFPDWLKDDELVRIFEVKISKQSWMPTSEKYVGKII